MWFEKLITVIFGFSLFINAALFLPQLIKLLKNKQAKDLSCVTFLGFCLIQLSAIAYGCLHKDMVMIVGYGLSFAACGSLTFLIFKYNNSTHLE